MPDPPALIHTCHMLKAMCKQTHLDLSAAVTAHTRVSQEVTGYRLENQG